MSDPISPKPVPRDRLDLPPTGSLLRELDIVFEGAGPADARFVEIEDQDGRSVRVGEWVSRDDGCVVLRLDVGENSATRAQALLSAKNYWSDRATAAEVERDRYRQTLEQVVGLIETASSRARIHRARDVAREALGLDPWRNG